MRLIYKKGAPPQLVGKPVKVGDVAILSDGQTVKVTHFREPHKPSAEGRVVVKSLTADEDDFGREYYVGVIHAEWIEREDRSEVASEAIPIPTYRSKVRGMNTGIIDLRYTLNQLQTASESLERAILKTPTGEVRNAMTDVNIKLNLLIEETGHVLDVAKKADV